MVNNIFQVLKNQAILYPNKVALIDQKQYTYEKLFKQVLYFSHILRTKYNIKDGNNIGILLPNISEFVISLFAINKLGAVSVPINIRLDQNTMQFIIKKAEIHLLITNQELEERLGSIGNINEIIIEKNRSYFENTASLVNAANLEKKNHSLNTKNDIALIVFTSGTTGEPKGAMMTNKNVLFNCHSCKVCFQLKSSDIQLIVVPLFHVTGLNSQLLASIYMANTVVLLRKYKTEDVYIFLKKYRITVFIAVPSVFILLLEKMKSKLKNLTSLSKIGYAGAPMPVNVIYALKEQFPHIKCFNFYGLTETSSISTVLSDKYALTAPDSVGIPAPGVNMKVMNNQGEEAAIGQAGELLIKGNNIIKGYFHDPEKTKTAIKDGWLYTGDIAKMDKQGRIFLLGRKKEVINRGGEKIYPIILENKLHNFRKIREAAIIGIPHKIFGEAVSAFIVKKEGVKLSGQEVLKYCQKYFADFEIPYKIVFVEKLPRNANGKVQKDELKKYDFS